MFATQFAGAIERAQFSDLNALAQKLWAAYAAGLLGEQATQALAERIESRRPKRTEPTSFRPAAVAAKPQRSPDKQASIERRRRLARASPVPPELVHEFTTSEHATMTILVGEIQKHGLCSRCIDAIAALAGTCRTVVRNTLNKARRFNLLQREERRRRGQKSLTNLVRIINPVWRQWLSWIGRRKMRSTMDTDLEKAKPEHVERSGDRVFTLANGVRGSKQMK
jgi:hypothetical protein